VRTAAAPLLLALAACASTVKDLPAAGPDAKGQALLAARLAFEGSSVLPSLHLESSEGKYFVIRPEESTFLVAIPEGTYTIAQFGRHAPRGVRLSIEARKGEARYVGTFAPILREGGALSMTIVDERAEVEAKLRKRYGADTPALATALAETVVKRLDPAAPLVVALEEVRPPRPYPAYYYDPFYDPWRWTWCRPYRSGWRGPR